MRFAVSSWLQIIKLFFSSCFRKSNEAHLMFLKIELIVNVSQFSLRQKQHRWWARQHDESTEGFSTLFPGRVCALIFAACPLSDPFLCSSRVYYSAHNILIITHWKALTTCHTPRAIKIHIMIRKTKLKSWHFFSFIMSEHINELLSRIKLHKLCRKRPKKNNVGTYLIRASPLLLLAYKCNLFPARIYFCRVWKSPSAREDEAPSKRNFSLYFPSPFLWY